MFKVRSSSYIKNGTEGYFAKVDFEEGFHIGEIRIRHLKQDFQVSPEEFSVGDAKEAWGSIGESQNDHLFSNITKDHESRVRELLSNNCVQYFPHNRFEEPAWLNEAHLNFQAELRASLQVQGSTERKVVNYSPLRENQNWLFGLLYDRAVFETQTINLPLAANDTGQSVPLPVQIGPSGNATSMYEVALQVVRNIIREDEGVRFGIGRRHGRVVTLEGSSGNVVPNVFQLSSGETSLLNLFLSILRDFDNGGTNLSSAEAVRGIVVVDEIDLHLHAIHQYDVLPTLIKMFPNVQFIVSSHSPLFVLGMAHTLGEDNFALFRMPRGQQISPEEFSEFGDAYRTFTATSKFSDDIRAAVTNAQAPILYLEGKTDVKYLWKAATLLGYQTMLKSIAVDEREGGGNLKNTWKALESLSDSLVTRRILLLHDCDFTGPDLTNGNRFRRTIPPQSGHPLEKGIENLFSQTALEKALRHKPEFIDITPEHSKTVRGQMTIIPEQWVVNEDEKTNLCDWFCENGLSMTLNIFRLYLTSWLCFSAMTGTKNAVPHSRHLHHQLGQAPQ